VKKEDENLPEPLPLIGFATISMIEGLDYSLHIDFKNKFNTQVISLHGDGAVNLDISLVGNFLPIKLLSTDITINFSSWDSSSIQINELTVKSFLNRNIPQPSLNISTLTLCEMFYLFSSEVKTNVDTIFTKGPLQNSSFISNLCVNNESTIDLKSILYIDSGDFSKVTFNVHEIYNHSNFSTSITFGSKYSQSESFKKMNVSVIVTPTSTIKPPSDYTFFTGKWQGNVLDKILLLTNTITVDNIPYNVSVQAINNTIHLFFEQSNNLTSSTSSKSGGLKRSELILIIAVSAGCLAIIVVVIIVVVGRNKPQPEEDQ